jgi:hypothetical protein
MNEKCVLTIRVMVDTDKPYQARRMASQIEATLPDLVDDTQHHFILDTEIDGEIGFHGGRSFLYREPSTAGEW